MTMGGSWTATAALMVSLIQALAPQLNGLDHPARGGKRLDGGRALHRRPLAVGLLHHPRDQ